MRDAPVYGLALAGGHSTRMGTDKAALRYGDQPQLTRLMTLLAELCPRVFVSARHDQHDALRQRWPIIADEHTNIGPMAGLLAAQQAHPHAAWLMVACDLPLINAATLNQLLTSRDQQHDSLAFIVDGVAQPMCSLWEAASAPRLTAALQSGQHSLRYLLSAPYTYLLTPTQPQALRNTNTPEQYRELHSAAAATHS